MELVERLRSWRISYCVDAISWRTGLTLWMEQIVLRAGLGCMRSAVMLGMLPVERDFSDSLAPSKTGYFHRTLPLAAQRVAAEEVSRAVAAGSVLDQVVREVLEAAAERGGVGRFLRRSM